MAKHASLIMGQMTGKLGDAVFSVRKGVQEVRKYNYSNSSNGNGATLAQRIVRLRLASLAGMYAVLKPFMQYAFQSKSNLISDYNAFVKANASNNVIVFSKQEISNGSQCVGPVIIANGTLPEIVCDAASDVIYRIGLKAAITAATTVAQFAAEVIAKNIDWQYGDKLTIALIKNGVRAGQIGDVWTSRAQYYTITLDATDTRKMSEVAPLLKSASDGFLTIDDAVGVVCTSIAACHSRKNGTKLFVSPTFVCCDNDDVVTILAGEEHHTEAMNSYGYKAEALLEPGVVAGGVAGGVDDDVLPEPEPENPSAPVINAVKLNSNTITKGSAQTVNVSPSSLEVIGSGFAGMSASDVTTTAGTISSVQISDTKISFNLSTTEGQYANVKVGGVCVAIITHASTGGGDDELPPAE